jgi:hypothetical protein
MNIIDLILMMMEYIMITKYDKLIIYIMIMILFIKVMIEVMIGIFNKMEVMDIIKMIMKEFLILYSLLLLIFITC